MLDGSQVEQEVSLGILDMMAEKYGDVFPATEVERIKYFIESTDEVTRRLAFALIIAGLYDNGSDYADLRRGLDVVDLAISKL